MNTKAKPFIKWVGGKGQLIEQLEAKLPADFDNWENATYTYFPQHYNLIFFIST